ncbi:MAG: metallophosphoesterase [Firmicutes bacterium]|uniref:Phosphoesterase n=1 Tax=Melghirimyces thermohalophilus TaxID=1236220 RepID=A0A1G6JRG7_9BACL|nr:metallophosphoesterase [Melghirimyces thermohalophilus]MDA8352537.1 metallophosphoesterase [Bacillota bacterium]SDC21340.1 hypothetical protein SAMN04488112_104153 [Melghirimyces thermohalophilus]
MRVLIVSDSHGQGELLRTVVDRVDADHVIHCGDFCTEASHLPTGSLTVVRGNCDWEEVREEAYWDGGPHRFYVTHGHRHQVRSTLLPIQYRAQENGADIACYGHTHYPLCEQADGVLLINPGSLVDPRGFPHPSYAILEMEGEEAVTVAFYTPDGTLIPERGGAYTLHLRS